MITRSAFTVAGWGATAAGVASVMSLQFLEGGEAALLTSLTVATAGIVVLGTDRGRRSQVRQDAQPITIMPPHDPEHDF